MVETIVTTAEVAAVAGSLGAVGLTAGKFERDKKGNITGFLLNKKRAVVGTAVVSTATSATYVAQEQSYKNTINNVTTAQAYIEAMSDEKLAELSEMLEKKEAEFDESDLTKDLPKVHQKKY